MRRFLFLCITGWLVLIPALSSAAPASKIIKAQSLSLVGEARYSGDFRQFDYANPDAPKGGILKLASIGTFDSLNQYATKGKVPDFLFIQYDRLMTRSQDEAFALYPMLATSIEYAEDLSWVGFNLNPKARFHDGRPVTAEDLVFSLDLLKNQGSPYFRKTYQAASHFKAPGPHRFEINIAPEYRSKKTLALLAYIPALPKHFWEKKDFDHSQLTIPLGSGPMKIASINPGHTITYERVKDYWAKDLPANKGQFNFDRMRIDYYRDNNAALEAFAAGAYDLRIESDPRNWHQKYNFPAVKDGNVVKEKVVLRHPHGMGGLVFNTRRPIFQDRKVRLALNYLFDFEWTNQHLLHSEYQRTNSFFVNTDFAASGLPGGKELALLKEFEARLSPEIFTKPPQQPESDGSGNNRKNQKIALQLLKEAGWQLKKGKMVHTITGDPMEFEILLSSHTMERIFIPYSSSLAKVGIQASIQTVDDSRFRKRAKSFDFDMVEWHFWQSAFPGAEMNHSWNSKAADEKDSNNLAGVKDPVIDALLAPLSQNSDYQEIIPRLRAVDRILLWENYLIPKWHKNDIYVAYRSYLDHPDHPNLNWFNASLWWHKSADKQIAK